MPGRRSGLTIGWLLAATVAQVAALLLVRHCFVHTEAGQRFDTISLAGSTIGYGHVDGLVNLVLNAMSVLSLVAATAVVGFIALARRRVMLAAMATLLIVGANATTQLLKHATERPDVGVDIARVAAGNSLPSGHTTVAASVAVALVLVLPAQVRGAAALLGAGYAGLAGVATLSAGWHRPSDAVAAYLVVGAWAAGVGLALVIFSRWPGTRPQRHQLPLTTLLLTGITLLGLAAAGMWFTGQVLSTSPELLPRDRLFIAYIGGAAGIAGVASLMMALVLLTLPRVVPENAPLP